MMRSTAAQLLCFLSTINVVLARELASRNKTVLLGLTKTQLMIGVPVTIGVVGLIAFGIWHIFFKEVPACNHDGKTKNKAECLCTKGNETTKCATANPYCNTDGKCNAEPQCDEKFTALADDKKCVCGTAVCSVAGTNRCQENQCSTVPKCEGATEGTEICECKDGNDCAKNVCETEDNKDANTCPAAEI